MLLLKGRMKLASSMKTKFKIFLRKSWALKTLMQRERVYPSKRKKSRSRLRTAVCKYAKERKNLKKQKSSDVFVNKDSRFETVQRRKEPWEEVKVSVNRYEGCEERKGGKKGR